MIVVFVLNSLALASIADGLLGLGKGMASWVAVECSGRYPSDLGVSHCVVGSVVRCCGTCLDVVDVSVVSVWGSDTCPAEWFDDDFEACADGEDAGGEPWIEEAGVSVLVTVVAFVACVVSADC